MSRAGTFRRTSLAIAVTAVLTLCIGGVAGSQVSPGFNGAQLSAGSFTVGAQTFAEVDLQLQDSSTIGQAPGLAARVDLTLPAGYGLNLSGAPGQPVGQLLGSLVTGNGSDSAFANGVILADDPASWAADPVAQACAPGLHAAVWHAAPTVLGQAVRIPIAIDNLSGPGAAPSYVLRICPTQPPSATFPYGVSLQSLSLLFANVVTLPTAPGSYSWSALVTPTAPGSLAPQPDGAFELRAVERRPSLMTMHAVYEPQTQTVAINGRVIAGGAGWAGIAVSASAQTGATGFPTSLGTTTTKADGSFLFRVSATRSEAISASVSIPAHDCTRTSTAPQGCVSETDTAPPGATATVIIPRKTDPQLAVRARDQALARASVLRTGDFPGSSDSGGTPLQCAAFTPHLHGLTATGEASSDAFVASDQRSAAFASATVLRTVDEARADFAGVAQLNDLRCEMAETIGGNQNEQVLGVGPLRIPHVGTASRAFRAQVADPSAGRLTVDLLFIRAGRVVITLHVYTIGSPKLPLDLQLARALVGRAGK